MTPSSSIRKYLTDINTGYIRNRQVFSDAQETKLVTYLANASSVYFGLLPREVRAFAYQCAKAHDITMPPSWSENELAGVDWFNGFLKRHPQISVRTPEATSLARATAFNKHNVNTYFDKLSSVMDRYSFEASNIWNLDETGLTTVQRPCRVVAQKGVKQVGAVTSGERGELVTLCQAVSAVGNTVPPMFIFPPPPESTLKITSYGMVH